MQTPSRAFGIRRRLAVSTLALATLACAPAAADAADGIFKGKTISVYVGYTPGGTNDITTRVVAHHIGRHMDGGPTTVVKNMPGAGSRKLAAYLYAKAAKDGTEFGNIDRKLSTDSLLQFDNADLFEPLKLTWIGSPTQETLTCISWHTSAVQTLSDLMTKPYVIASPGSGSGEVTASNVLNNLLGAKSRAVTGYPGGAEMNLAMQRGEVDGRCGIGWAAIKATNMDWITKKEATVLLQMARRSHPELTSVPVLYDLVKTERDRQVLDLLFVEQDVGRPFVAPPGMEDGRKRALRAAFDATMTDPEFLAECARLNLEVRPVTGEALERLLAKAHATPAPIVEQARKLATAN